MKTNSSTAFLSLYKGNNDTKIYTSHTKESDIQTNNAKESKNEVETPVRTVCRIEEIIQSGELDTVGVYSLIEIADGRNCKR